MAVARTVVVVQIVARPMHGLTTCCQYCPRLDSLENMRLQVVVIEVVVVAAGLSAILREVGFQ